MESSSSKVEAMKPVIFKAGIPLALSLAGFIIARIATHKTSLSTASSQRSRTHEDTQELDSTERYDDHTYIEADNHGNELLSSSSSQVRESRELEEKILGQRRRIEAIQGRTWQLEKRFSHYQDLKDQEIALMEIENKIILEINRVEFLGREVLFVEAENQRFKSIAVDYLKLLRMLEFFRLENGKLHKRVKKLLRKSKEHSRILRKQRMQIQCKETKISRNKKKLELKDDWIMLREDENKELKLIIEQLQGEKDELRNKLKAAEESAASKVEGETVSIEEYNQLASELERIQQQETTGVQELTYLRWSNACLRHELMKKSQEQEHAEINNQMDNNFVGIEEFGSENEVNRSSIGKCGHSRRRKLIAKLKRWVEGSEKEKNGTKCFQKHSVSDEEAFLPARNSFSSV